MKNNFYLSTDDENNFVGKLSKKFNFNVEKHLMISDMIMSRRQISSNANNLINIIKNMENNSNTYVPIQFNYKKAGDQKHRMCLFITKNNNITIELFDSNSWNYMLDDKKYNNKPNLKNILIKVREYFNNLEIIPYNFSLNIIDGYCVSLTLIYLLYKVSNININQVFSFYNTRIKVHYEKEVYKLLKKKELNWNTYHNIITELINNENN